MGNFFPPVTTEALCLPTYLYAVGSNHSEKKVVREDGYPYVHLLFTFHGEGRISFPENTYILDQSSVALFPAGQPHSYCSVSERWETGWIVFSGSHIGYLLSAMGFERGVCVSVPNMGIILKSFDALWNMKNKIYDAFKASSLVYQALSYLASVYKAPPLLQKQQIDILLQYIDTHYSEPLALPKLSQFAGISEQYLCRLFKEQLHMRPFEYINMIRINKAKEMLTSEKLPIDTISKLCGFESASYFGMKFKQETGLTPTHFSQLYAGRHKK